MAEHAAFAFADCTMPLKLDSMGHVVIVSWSRAIPLQRNACLTVQDLPADSSAGQDTA
jgi:hypothetical protein